MDNLLLFMTSHEIKNNLSLDDLFLLTELKISLSLQSFVKSLSLAHFCLQVHSMVKTSVKLDQIEFYDKSSQLSDDRTEVYAHYTI